MTHVVATHYNGQRLIIHSHMWDWAKKEIRENSNMNRTFVEGIDIEPDQYLAAWIGTKFVGAALLQCADRHMGYYDIHNAIDQKNCRHLMHAFCELVIVWMRLRGWRPFLIVRSDRKYLTNWVEKRMQLQGVETKSTRIEKGVAYTNVVYAIPNDWTPVHLDQVTITYNPKESENQ